MLEIKTDLATFGNWKDCYLYMKEEGVSNIHIIQIDYIFSKVLGSSHRTIEEVYQMAFEMDGVIDE